MYEPIANKSEEVKNLIEVAVDCGIEKDAELFYNLACIVYCGVIPAEEYSLDGDAPEDIEG